jgi:hypothetical protein
MRLIEPPRRYRPRTPIEAPVLGPSSQSCSASPSLILWLCVTRSLRHHLSHDMTAEAPAYTLSEDQSPFEREGSGG